MVRLTLFIQKEDVKLKKMAIIGTGIAGMSSAYFLKDDYEISVFEKNDYIGGHTNTITINDGEKDCPVDTGFMVFNEHTYPNLIKLFEKLKVDFTDTDMGFAVRNEVHNLEYNGSSLDGVFSQRKNLFNISFLKMLFDINKFNTQSVTLLSPNARDMTLQDLVNEFHLGNYFFENYLLPMTSSIWSTPMNKMKDYPAKSMIRFLKNHGLLGMTTQHQWKTVVGGSICYRDKLIKEFQDSIVLSAPIQSVIEKDGKVILKVNDQEHTFDKVIICAHADEALAMLENPSDFQKDILSKFEYQENIATVHTDSSVMPQLRKNWSSWNFINKGDETYTVYYMNKLQKFSDKLDVFISINGTDHINKQKILKEIVYFHPVFDLEAVRAQARIDELNKQSNIHFSGSYYRYGFHEDALLSSIKLCESLLGKKVL